ncbi:MAG: sugar phosphate isomerase/epimerase family protein [Methylophilus sp.]|nr:sugar phosphate isomerase/epimerase family protein [Methylophilus sp.]
MRLAISNIAWDTVEDEAVANLLNQYQIDAIDVAPGKYFPVPTEATNQEIQAVKNWWAARGVEITGMQALLFGTTGLNVFGNDESQQAMLNHLNAVCRIAAGLGAQWLVFGSPKNRDRNGLSDEQAMSMAVPFFRHLGDIAQSHGVTICLEPNPAHYGANFMINSSETAQVVREVNHLAIKMQLDTGAMTINHEIAEEVLQNVANLIGHIHASEPDLVPVGDGATNHEAVYAAVNQYLPQHVVSIEMVATKTEPHIVAIERALKVAIQSYRQAGAAL